MTKKKAKVKAPVPSESLRPSDHPSPAKEGRRALPASLADFESVEQAPTGESRPDRSEAVLDALPESKRWDPVPGSEGTQAPESPSEDEDDEGRSETEQLVDDGVMEAEREQAGQATRAAKPKDGH